MQVRMAERAAVNYAMTGAGQVSLVPPPPPGYTAEGPAPPNPYAPAPILDSGWQWENTTRNTKTDTYISIWPLPLHAKWGHALASLHAHIYPALTKRRRCDSLGREELRNIHFCDFIYKKTVKMYNLDFHMACRRLRLGLFLLDRHVELEFRWKLFLTKEWKWNHFFEILLLLNLPVQSVREIHSTDSTVGVKLDPESLDIIGAISSPCKIRQIELNLVPSLVQLHRHRANKRFDSGRRLVVGSPEPSPDIFVIQYLIKRH